MQSTFAKQFKAGICISVLLGLNYLANPATGWQFRDLDSSSAADSAEGSASDAELTPTSESFVAPVINASELTQKPARLKVALKEATKPVMPEPTASSTKLEPVPMPELHTLGEMPEMASKEQQEVAADDPMSAFGSPQRNRSEAPNPRHDVRAAKFNNVQAGTTKLSELKQLWGEPVEIIHRDEAQTLIYKVPSFQQVDVTVEGDLVTSVLVHLSEPLKVTHVAEELDLAEFAPVPIPDEFGEVLGQAYPERGLLFNFTDDLQQLRVSAILLEPLSGEMFRLRAQHDFDHQYDRSLADLDEAILIDPNDSEAFWLKAEIQDASGRTRDAVKSIQKAIRLQTTNPLYRLTRARLLAKTNQYAAAVDEVRAVLDEIDMPAEIEARAHALLGDLLAVGADANHQDALKHHLKAVDFAMKVVDDRRFAVRRMAKHVLVDAHMAIARDVAMGNFQRQQEVVPKWLLRATELADEFVSDDHGDELLQMHIFRTTLDCYDELPGNFDAAIASEEALRAGRQLIADASDLRYKVQIERLLAEILMHSAKIERTRGRHDSAMKYANNGLALIKNARDQWQATSHDRYLEGQLYFLIGSLYAIQQEDHYAATEWYAKARDIFVDNDFVSPLYNEREHGEIHVSMGVSLWETGEHEKAVKLTQLGAELMKNAVERGSLQVAALAVPYGNLATMHGKLGHNDKSQQFAKLVAKVEKLAPDETRR